MSLHPALRIGLAALAALSGLTAATLVDHRIVAAVLVFLVLGAVLWCVLPLRHRTDNSALAAVAIIPSTVLLVGLPMALAQYPDPADGSGSARPPADGPSFAAPTDRGVESLGDLDERLRAALDQADALLPEGSASVLRIDLGGFTDGLTVAVFDPGTGNELTAYRSGADWRAADPRRATNRQTFSRADVAGMNLTAARPQVIAAADRLQVDRSFIHASDAVTIARRHDDGLLVATFSLSGRQLEVNTQGRLPDTLGAATLPGMLAVARSLVVDSGLDPATAEIYELQYRAYDSGASSVSATAIQGSGGIEIRFAGGSQAGSAKVVPGRFPVIDRKPAAMPPGFPFRDIAEPVLLSVHRDLLSRGDVPDYDAGLVGLAIALTSGDDYSGPVLRMRIGPHAAQTQGTYALDGRWLADRVF